MRVIQLRYFDTSDFIHFTYITPAVEFETYPRHTFNFKLESILRIRRKFYPKKTEHCAELDIQYKPYACFRQNTA